MRSAPLTHRAACGSPPPPPSAGPAGLTARSRPRRSGPSSQWVFPPPEDFNQPVEQPAPAESVKTLFPIVHSFPSLSTELDFVVLLLKTFRAANKRPKTGLPRPVSRGWGGLLTLRQTAGPGPARVLVHWGETWSHPRGTLGRCLKGSEINIQDYKNRNCSLCPFRPESRIKPVFPGSAHKIQPAGKAIFSVRGGLHFCPKCGIIFCCKNIRMSVLLKEV